MASLQLEHNRHDDRQRRFVVAQQLQTVQRHVAHHAQGHVPFARRLHFDKEELPLAAHPFLACGWGAPDHIVLGMVQLGADLTRGFPAHGLRVEIGELSSGGNQLQQGGCRQRMREHPAEAGVALDPGKGHFGRVGRERVASVEWRAIFLAHHLLVWPFRAQRRPVRDDGSSRPVLGLCHSKL